MRDFGGRDAAAGDLALLGACLAVALLAYALPRRVAADVVATLRTTALRPAVALRERAARDRTSRFALEGIQAERDSLALRATADAALRRENDELRRTLGVGRAVTTPWIGAEVLHRPTPTDSRTLSLDVGSEDGVQLYDPVVTADGLVGYLWSVGAASSVVLTWMHPEFGASAVTGDGAILGFLQPVTVGALGHPMLELRGIALSDSLPDGSEVFTSGLGGVYPRQVPVGRIVGVEPDPLGYERFYRVAPHTNPGAIGHVMVLTAPRDSVFVVGPLQDTLP